MRKNSHSRSGGGNIRALRLGQIALATFATVLFSINIAGFVIPLRNPEIYQEKNTCFADDISMTGEELLRQAKGMTQNDPGQYFESLTGAVSRAMACYWDDEGITKYNLRVPVQENYLLFAASYLRPENYRKYRFCDYQKAIQRGVGYCDQHAFVIEGLLKENRYETRIVALDGHVVAAGKLRDDNWWILDADYGVVIKHSLSEIENDPELVRQPYLASGYSPSVADEMVNIYGKKGNHVFGDVKEYFRSDHCAKEKASYILIWLIPAVCILMVPVLPLLFR